MKTLQMLLDAVAGGNDAGTAWVELNVSVRSDLGHEWGPCCNLNAIAGMKELHKNVHGAIKGSPQLLLLIYYFLVHLESPPTRRGRFRPCPRCTVSQVGVY